MGRKIPARKHHGVRDPIKQAAERYEKIKHKIDNPPTKTDDQKISNSFARFIKLKESVKKGTFKKLINKSKHGREDKPKSKNMRPEKKYHNFKPKPNENDGQFMMRVNRETKDSLIEASYEAKYGVDVIRDKKTGNISIKKRADELLVKKPKKKFQLTKEQKNLVKEQILKEKQNKKEQKSGKVEEYKRDVVKFGEVVNAPPVISTIPRLAKKHEKTTRPGQRNLLLTPMIKENNENNTEKPFKSNLGQKILKSKTKIIINNVDLKGKRKDLPIGTRAMLERERQSTVDLYRMLKKQKMKANQQE